MGDDLLTWLKARARGGEQTLPNVLLLDMGETMRGWLARCVGGAGAMQARGGKSLRGDGPVLGERNSSWRCNCAVCRRCGVYTGLVQEQRAVAWARMQKGKRPCRLARVRVGCRTAHGLVELGTGLLAVGLVRGPHLGPNLGQI